MTVYVKRYQRNRIMGDENSPKLYYLKPEPKSFQVVNIDSIAKEIETTGALSAEDVTHTMRSFVRVMKKHLVQGNRVKVDGLGTFHVTFTCAGSEVEKDCTVRSISRVHLRFFVDTTLQLANDSTATTRGGENNVCFAIRSEVAGAGGNDPGDGGEGNGPLG